MSGDPRVSAAKPAVIAMVLLAVAAAVFVAIRAAVTGPVPVPDRFKFDDAKYRKTDPSHVIYRETDRIATGLAEPRGVAVDASGRIYVVGDDTLAVFEPSGAELARTRTGGRPRCVAVALDGTVFVGMGDHVDLWYGPPKNTLGARWRSLGPKAIVTSIAVTNREIYVFDAGNKTVVRFGALGQVLGRFGHEGPDSLVIYQTCGDVATLAEDLLFVTNPGRTRVQVHTMEGELSAHWGEGTPDIEGFSPCCNPVNIAVLPDGSVVTAEKNIPRVKVHASSGRFVGVVAGAEEFGGGAGDSKGLIDVAADKRGRVLVLDPWAKAVRIFERTPDADGGSE
jgi:hypothetical protein